MVQSVSPQSIEELQRIFSESTELKRPTYVYREAAGDGLCVDLSRLNKIIEIDAANLVATVQPGVKLLDLSLELVRQKLRFIPADTPFYRDKTVGELFYEGCSNISGLKYGITKHFLMGSEVVLPTGEILKTGGKTVKNVTGYDVTRFFNAPYTNYGVTAKFLLKLFPLPKSRKSMAITFANFEDLFNFTRDMKNARVVPAYLLWIDTNTQAIFQEKNASVGGQLLLTEFDGLDEETAEQYQTTLPLIEKYKGKIVEDSDDCTQAAVNWSVLYRPNGKYALTDEFKMAFTTQENFVKSLCQLLQKSGVKAGLFGQLSEGKLNIVFDAPACDANLIGEIMKTAAAAGAVSSGKYNLLAGKTNSNEVLVNLARKGKAAFDPQNILNPVPEVK